MSETFLLEIVTPTEFLFSGEVDLLTAPGFEGEFGILKGHTDYLSVLKPGELRYRHGGAETSLFITKGYSVVTPDKTTILIEGSTPTAEMNAALARTEAAEAEEALKGLSDGEPGFREATEKLEAAQVKIFILENKKGH